MGEVRVDIEKVGINIERGLSCDRKSDACFQI